MRGPKSVRYVACPACGARVAWEPESRFRPFCSERCKLSDLGAWANEEYRVPGPPEEPGESHEEDRKI
jgi:endogenous inhibitor of DNA gyrase (YacG/DUF329 family)